MPSTESSIKAVIFDMAGVLIPPLNPHWNVIEKDLGLVQDSIMNTMKEEKVRLVYKQVELGEMSCADFEHTFNQFYKEKNNVNIPHFSAFLFAEDIYTRNDLFFAGMAKLIAKLKLHNIKTAVITNNYWLDKEKNNSALYIKNYAHFFDEIVESCKVHMRKPDAEIFEYTLNKLQVKPNEVVYLDDQQHNLDYPIKAGWHTIFVQNEHQAIHDLEGLVKFNLE